ncbi:uncharacterized protein LOC126566015 [Anopheles maculipalpis]|uniref:uncharacterized protein LOC126566015 n=1 Tax=Anopheles maculipalpis TaxID=1496333 RepID=UPI002158B910|nr:uncharacterized protein LOC126566015 [Anopheles maculipalpis]
MADSMLQDPLYRHVMSEVKLVYTHISWMSRYYYTWNNYNSPLLYLRRASWSFMRTNMNFVTETWANLNTLVANDGRPELKALLKPLEDRTEVWESSKKFLEDVIQRSEYYYAQKWIDDDD